jgi:hypothetical protein
MKLGIMQPYFLPYIGYWQLLNAVDKYIVYDNIEYSVGWINRNRFLQSGKDGLFTIPLKKDSDYLNICERRISDSFDKPKLMRRLKNSYFNAPYFDDAFPVVEKIINFGSDNLFYYLLESIKEICSYLMIDASKIIISSAVHIDHSLRSEQKVMALCKELKADEYYNAIGGIGLYDKNEFACQGIDLKFLKTNLIEYKQFYNEFVPSLSIVDVMMFNSVEVIIEMLKEYELV